MILHSLRFAFPVLSVALSLTACGGPAPASATVEPAPYSTSEGARNGTPKPEATLTPQPVPYATPYAVGEVHVTGWAVLPVAGHVATDNQGTTFVNGTGGQLVAISADSLVPTNVPDGNNWPEDFASDGRGNLLALFDDSLANTVQVAIAPASANLTASWTVLLDVAASNSLDSTLIVDPRGDAFVWEEPPGGGNRLLTDSISSHRPAAGGSFVELPPLPDFVFAPAIALASDGTTYAASDSSILRLSASEKAQGAGWEALPADTSYRKYLHIIVGDDDTLYAFHTKGSSKLSPGASSWTMLTGGPNPSNDLFLNTTNPAVDGAGKVFFVGFDTPTKAYTLYSLTAGSTNWTATPIPEAVEINPNDLSRHRLLIDARSRIVVSLPCGNVLRSTP